MPVEFIKITGTEHLHEFVDVQRRAFNLNEIDIFPTSFLSMLTRTIHPLGFLIGCYMINDNSRNLIGMAVAISDVPEKSVYCPFVCILPEHQNGTYGYTLINKMKEVALENGYESLFGIFDPLNSSLCKLYTRLGAKITKYIANSFVLNEKSNIPVDRVLFEWKMNSSRVKERVYKPLNISISDSLKEFPQINKNSQINSNKILIEVPNELGLYKESEDQKPFDITEFLSYLEKYINDLKYSITDCISGKVDSTKKIYYLLEK